MRAPVYDGPHFPACWTCTLMASPATSLMSHAVLISRSSRLRRHCCFDRAREPLFEIDDADPFRIDADPQHLQEHLLHLTDPRLTLLFPKVSLGTRDMLGNDTFYCLRFRGSANLQDLMRPVVGVDGHRHLRILAKRFHFWRRQRCSQHDLVPSPMKPDWNDARSTVGTDVGESRRYG